MAFAQGFTSDQGNARVGTGLHDNARDRGEDSYRMREQGNASGAADGIPRTLCFPSRIDSENSLDGHSASRRSYPRKRSSNRCSPYSMRATQSLRCYRAAGFVLGS